MALPITPPASAQALAIAAQAAGGGVTPVEATVTGTPPNVTQLLRQIQISGTVVAAPENGAVTLATALGNFSFSLAQLPEDVRQQVLSQLESLFQSQKPVTAVVQPGTPPSQAVLLLPSSAGAQTPAAVLPPALAQPLTLSPGASLSAVILPSGIVVPGAAGVAQPSPVPAQAGNNPAGAAGTPVNLPQAADDESIPQGAAPLPVAPAPVLPPGKEVIVRVDAVALSAASLPEPEGNQVSATVIGNGANGQLIVKTASDATLYVRASVEAPIGTNLLVRIEIPKTPAPAVLPQVDSQNFASLQQTLDAVAQISPQMAQQIIATRVPQPNAQLAGPLLFFLSALKQGDAKGWLGSDVAEALARAGKMELLAKLGHDLQGSPQTARDPAVGEWKSYPVPMHNDGQFQALTLYVHSDGRGTSPDADGKVSPQVRFLIDVRMSRLGAMQLDGLVRPKKLDMIVRSESALPPGLPQELRASYSGTIEALGYTGGLSFQAGRQHWLTPRRETPKSVVT